MNTPEQQAATWLAIYKLAKQLEDKRMGLLPGVDQCESCACFTDAAHGGIVNGLCLDCRNPELDPFPVDPDKPYGDTI